MDESDVRRITVNSIRSIVGSVYLLLGKPFLGRHLITFVFHEVSDQPRSHARDTKTFSNIKTFQRQIRWIGESFRVLNLKADASIDQVGDCVLSFDDGYAGVMLNALPLLEDLKMPFIAFINMATINGEVNSSALAMYVAAIEKRPVNWRDSNPHFYVKALETLSAAGRREIDEYQGPYLTRRELESLSRSPLVTIGDHLHNHWFMDELTNSELESELVRSRSELLEYESHVDCFASPHGLASEDALEVLRKHSFQRVFSGNRHQILDGMRIYPRIDLNNEISSERRFFGAIVISILRPFIRSLFKVGMRNISK